MTGYSQLDKVMAMAAEHEAKAASYRYLNRDRSAASRTKRDPRSKREPRTHRLGFGGPLLGR